MQKRSRIILVSARLFGHLNDPYVLNELYMNDTSLVVITPNQEFC